MNLPNNNISHLTHLDNLDEKILVTDSQAKVLILQAKELIENLDNTFDFEGRKKLQKELMALINAVFNLRQKLLHFENTNQRGPVFLSVDLAKTLENLIEKNTQLKTNLEDGVPDTNLVSVYSNKISQQVDVILDAADNFKI